MPAKRLVESRPVFSFFFFSGVDDGKSPFPRAVTTFFRLKRGRRVEFGSVMGTAWQRSSVFRRFSGVLETARCESGVDRVRGKSKNGNEIA